MNETEELTDAAKTVTDVAHSTENLGLRERAKLLEHAADLYNMADLIEEDA